MIVTVSNHVDTYRVKAKFSRDVHQLDGRSGNRARTEFINRAILEVLAPQANQSLVDVGCGDGCLLQLLKQSGHSEALGVTATEEEERRLRALGLQVRQGFTDHLPVPAETADLVVCNGVFVIVPGQKIPASMREIARVAKPGALIFLGEIPQAAELANVPRSSTAAELLWYLLKTHGVRTFLGMCRRMLWSSLRGVPMVLNTAPNTEFYARPDDFVRLAADCGMQLERYFPAKDLDPSGAVRTMETRMNYLFKKAA